MVKKTSLSSTIPTRERILRAALHRFSNQSYEHTGLRDIAADADVDVAYVHRLFGSKQQLFAEAMRKAASNNPPLNDLSGDLTKILTERVLSRGRVGDRDGIDPLDIAVHSLSSPEATEVQRKLIVSDLIEPLAHRLQDPAMHRAALIIALMAGFSILKNVIGIKELQDAERRKLAPLLQKTLAALALTEAASHQTSTERIGRKT